MLRVLSEKIGRTRVRYFQGVGEIRGDPEKKSTYVVQYKGRLEEELQTIISIISTCGQYCKTIGHIQPKNDKY